MTEKMNQSKVTLEILQQSIDNWAISTQQSIEKLAIATASGFERVEKDIVEIKTDIVEIKTDISGLKQRVNSLDNRLDTFVDHERRLVKLETVLKLKTS